VALAKLITMQLIINIGFAVVFSLCVAFISGDPVDLISAAIDGGLAALTWVVLLRRRGRESSQHTLTAPRGSPGYSKQTKGRSGKLDRNATTAVVVVHGIGLQKRGGPLRSAR
jgi:hypothetical protein